MARSSNPTTRAAKLPKWASHFGESLLALNAEFWLITAAMENVRHMGTYYSPRTATPLPNYHEAVAACIPHASPATRERLRYRKSDAGKEIAEMSGQSLDWLPCYFLVIAKSITEGFLQDYINQRGQRDPAFEAKVRARVGRRTKTMVVEGLAQELARGDFNKARDVVDLTHHTGDLADKLRTYNNHRNEIAHRLGSVGMRATPPISCIEWQVALGRYQELISILPAP